MTNPYTFTNARSQQHRCRWLVVFVVGLASTQLPAPPIALAQENADEKVLRDGFLVQVALPITSEVQEQVEQTIRRLVEKVPAVSEASQRPVIVLEFDTSNSKTGRGSRIGSCLDLADFLSSNAVSNVETIAYIPEPRGFIDSTDPTGKRPQSLLNGHAVLVAIACQQLVMHRDSAIGQAGIDEQAISETRVNFYREIASKRRTLPIEVVLSMVDPNVSLFRVDVGDGKTEYADRDRLAELEAAGKAVNADTLTEPGNIAVYSSQELATYQLVRHRVASRRDIAQRFDLYPDSLEGDPTLGDSWNAVRFNLEGRIDQRKVSWILNALQKQSKDVNLIIVSIDSEGGDPNQCLRLANRLAEYDQLKVRTVAYVDNQARGMSALIALACDHLVMAPESTIGGNVKVDDGQPFPPPRNRQPPMPGIAPEDDSMADLRPPVQELARAKERDWSIMLAMIDSELVVKRYAMKGTGQLRLLSEKEFGELDQAEQALWLPQREIATSDGLIGTEAESLFVARYLVEDFSQLMSLYQLREEPQILQPTLADKWVESFARFLASPFVAGWLLFGAMFFISAEMSSPGISVPGFLGTLCLMLFFWSQYLDGNAHWLEIMLFVLGLIFIVLELFVLPGFGVFGFGGLVMVVVSIVLATQTFVIPTSSDEFRRLPVSLSMVVAASGGFLTAVFVFRKYLPNMPYFKRMMLHPASDDPSLESLSERESIVKWDHLVGNHGKAITPLVPAGKAKFGNQIVDVVSDGRLVEKGNPIVVTEVAGNRVVVRVLDDDLA